MSQSSNAVALMFADAANIKEMRAGASEEACRACLERWQKTLLVAGREYRGFLLRTIGGSLLFSFSDPNNALFCAIGILHESSMAAAEEPDAVTPRWRIGIHTGGVSPRLAKLAVKQTARMLVGATQNQIVISHRARALVKPGLWKLMSPVQVSAPKAAQLARPPYEIRWSEDLLERAAQASVEEPSDATVADFSVDAVSLETSLPLVSPPASLPEVPVAPPPVPDFDELFGAPGSTGSRLCLVAGTQHAVMDDEHPLVRIGRDGGNDIRVQSAMVSRQHCELRQGDGCFYLVDTSRNGTFVYVDNRLQGRIKESFCELAGEGMIAPGAPPKRPGTEVIFYRVNR